MHTYVCTCIPCPFGSCTRLSGLCYVYGNAVQIYTICHLGQHRLHVYGSVAYTYTVIKTRLGAVYTAPPKYMSNSCASVGLADRSVYSWVCHVYDTPARPRSCQPYSCSCLEILLIPISENIGLSLLTGPSLTKVWKIICISDRESLGQLTGCYPH